MNTQKKFKKLKFEQLICYRISFLILNCFGCLFASFASFAFNNCLWTSFLYFQRILRFFSVFCVQRHWEFGIRKLGSAD